MPKEFENFRLTSEHPVHGTQCSLCKLALVAGDIVCLILIGSTQKELAKVAIDGHGEAYAVGVHARCVKREIVERKQQT